MANCDNCTEKCVEIEKKDTPEAVPYIVYETELARGERHTKRWMIAFFVALAMLFASNIGWLIYESQFETYYYEQDGEGVNLVGDDNEVKQYEPTSESKEEKK